MHVHLKTLGCRLNEAELETWAQAFQAGGDRIVTSAKEADLVVLNSCAVTHEAVRKSRQVIRRIHRENPSAKLVVSGCYATLNAEEAARSMGVDLVIANRDKNRLVELTKERLAFELMPSISTEPAAVALFNRGRQRAFVKVQDGCRYRCTFCIVTVVRGEERSRTLQEIVDEINRLHRQGILEVILTGVHLGGYGSDRGTDLSRLIAAVLSETVIPRVRLGSLEPWELSESFFRLFENPRFMPHLHLPLQSGCDRILRRMARRCNTTDFARLIEQARSAVPDINITTDIIVGFPGETEQDWQSSLSYIERTRFGHIHIFSYSVREGTKAAGMPDQLPAEIKKQRSRQLHELAQAMKRERMRTCLGRTFPVLLESQPSTAADGIPLCFGYTPNYMRAALRIPEGRNLENQIRSVRLKSLSECGSHLLGELAESDDDDSSFLPIT
jgi:threonylcarbamoyladenosine tRNA methylthiotransferase MtaB